LPQYEGVPRLLVAEGCASPFRYPGGVEQAGLLKAICCFSDFFGKRRAKTSPGLILVRPPRSDSSNTALGTRFLRWHSREVRVRGSLRAYEVLHDDAYHSRQLGPGPVPQRHG
jgi:hypothetical protein